MNLHVLEHLILVDILLWYYGCTPLQEDVFEIRFDYKPRLQYQGSPLRRVISTFKNHLWNASDVEEHYCASPCCNQTRLLLGLELLPFIGWTLQRGTFALISARSTSTPTAPLLDLALFSGNGT